MSGRDLMLGSIRRALAVSGGEAERRARVAARLSEHPRGVVPARGQGGDQARRDLFVAMLQGAAGTVAVVQAAADVPGAVGDFLRGHNLPMRLRRGSDPMLAALPWDREPSIEVSTGASDGQQLVGLSHAFAAVAETGTLLLTSGPDNPTTLNFLPSNHIVVVAADRLTGDFETALGRLRAATGGALPRTVNMITGPSRSADIEQTLLLGAHGPLRLHVIFIDAPAGT